MKKILILLAILSIIALSSCSKDDDYSKNDDYAMENPLWIINYSERRHEDLPNFAKGEITKNGVTYLAEKVSQDKLNALANTRRNPIASVQVYSIKSTRNFDSIWQGGSDFRIEMTGLDYAEVLQILLYPSKKASIKKFDISIPRRDIKNGKTFVIEGNPTQQVVDTWENNIIANGVNVYEMDKGGSPGGKIFQTLGYYPEGVLSVYFQNSTEDDFIKAYTVNRGNLFPSNTASAYHYQNALGVYWVLQGVQN